MPGRADSDGKQRIENRRAHQLISVTRHPEVAAQAAVEMMDVPGPCTLRGSLRRASVPGMQRADIWPVALYIPLARHVRAFGV